MQLNPDEKFGHLHNRILGMARDADQSIRNMPALMAAMLKEDGWRAFKRPVDGKVFENETIDQWILSPAYAGLNFPDWPTVYAILQCNVEFGQECIDGLKRNGAPDIAQSTIDVALAEARATTRPGQGKRTDLDEHPPVKRKFKSYSNPTYLAKRLQEDHPETFDALGRGEFKSVRAAARSVGIVRDPTIVEQFERLWRKASPEDRAQIIRITKA